MPQNQIFWPMLALMLWTMLILLLVPIRRFRAAFAGRLKASDFAYGESDKVPQDVKLPNRVFMNLTEVPVLFYGLCLMGFVSHHVDGTLLVVAWLFVALRITHSVIYLSINHVIVRFSVFALSCLALLVMMVLLALRLM